MITLLHTLLFSAQQEISYSVWCIFSGVAQCYLTLALRNHQNSFNLGFFFFTFFCAVRKCLSFFSTFYLRSDNSQIRWVLCQRPMETQTFEQSQYTPVRSVRRCCHFYSGFSHLSTTSSSPAIQI